MERSLRDKIRIVAAGALHGEGGVVTGRDEVCGWYFVTLDRHADDPVYRHVQYGPFTSAEIEHAAPRRHARDGRDNVRLTKERTT